MKTDKPIYRIMDERGRVTIPKNLRDQAKIETGDVIELLINKDGITIFKVEVIHIDDTTQQSLQNTAYSAIANMDKKSLLKVSKRIVCELERKGK